METTARHFKRMLRVGVIAGVLVTYVAFAAPLGLPPVPVPADNPITPEKVKLGDKLFHSSKLGKNNVSCDQGHPNAANTHPETYPKFQKQIGKVVTLFEMVNWCLRNPLEGEPLAADDPRMVALLSYIHYERWGVPLASGKH